MQWRGTPSVVAASPTQTLHTEKESLMVPSFVKNAALLAVGTAIAAMAVPAGAQTKITLGMSGWTGFAPLQRLYYQEHHCCPHRSPQEL